MDLKVKFRADWCKLREVRRREMLVNNLESHPLFHYFCTTAPLIWRLVTDPLYKPFRSNEYEALKTRHMFGLVGVWLGLAEAEQNPPSPPPILNGLLRFLSPLSPREHPPLDRFPVNLGNDFRQSIFAKPWPFFSAPPRRQHQVLPPGSAYPGTSNNTPTPVQYPPNYPGRPNDNW